MKTRNSSLVAYIRPFAGIIVFIVVMLSGFPVCAAQVPRPEDSIQPERKSFPGGEQELSQDAEAVRKLSRWNEERREMGLSPVSYSASTTDETLQTSRRIATSRSASSGSSDVPVVSNVEIYPSSDPKLYYIRYDLDVPSGKKCTVSLSLQDRETGATIPAQTLDWDIGQDINPGQNHTILWNAFADWPNHSSDQVFATVTATEAATSSTWATVRIEWSEWGGRDLDICAYWADNPSQSVGYGWSSTAFSDINWESGDNTGSGPEYVRVSPEGSAGRRFIVRLNYYGQVGSSAKARVVAIGNGKTVSKVVTAKGNRTGSKAEKGDPGAVIEFGEFGEPVAIGNL